MSPEEIVAKFVEAFDLLEPILGQPSDVQITLLREVLTPILLQIPYDEAGAVDNLVGLILPAGNTYQHTVRHFAHRPASGITMVPSPTTPLPSFVRKRRQIGKPNA